MIAPLLALALMLLPDAALLSSDEEITLYDSDGKPTAYIAEDDLTIYLWSGEPVAYLSNGNHGTDVYGFNGKHLGWFESGYIRNNDGDGACGLKSVVRSPQFEPFKSFKKFKPFKSFKEFAPLKPLMTNNWSDTPCGITLRLGSPDAD